MNKELNELMRSDTLYVLNRVYNQVELKRGFSGSESPIFDALAADRFASDRTVFNLGDYR